MSASVARLESMASAIALTLAASVADTPRSMIFRVLSSANSMSF